MARHINTGNSGGKKGRSGRKSKAEEFGLGALLDKCWTLSDRQKVIRVLHKHAASGSIAAAQLLMSYAYGKPTEKHEHGGENGGPIIVKVVYAK